ncbi:hypothetical protein A3F65_02355 [Candidatus Saccharibacteria bacterium RIFCSPHIGHO2_12_FULL_47_16b]|nr:MAG: hypothetical protein A3F65_02355 [Candidatus Saccharibacteria bacterium RIFCSPHIGHO2_12_FULL_47_16b]OGL37900.1 MAG: hypothetical protein A3J32_02555 [Candidatus Saccharibacteria bacterium RIFCSPLOWO2_02_FULL_46_7]
MRTRDGVNLALKAIGLAGLAGLTIATPNAIAALGPLLRKSPAPPSDYQKIMRELKRQGLIMVSQANNSTELTLTPAGAHRLQRLIIDELEVPTPKKWDHKWRLIAFDIPVKQSSQRINFTAHLQHLGFYMLQRSLWVHPYPCFKEVEQLAGYFNVLRYCAFAELAKLDDSSTRKLVSKFSELTK